MTSGRECIGPEIWRSSAKRGRLHGMNGRGRSPTAAATIGGQQRLASAARNPLTRDQTHRAVEGAQHPFKLMAAAQDVTGCRNDAVRALPARQAWIFFDPVNREFGGATEYRKHGAIFQKIDRVIPPFTCCNLAAVETKNAVELAPVKSDLACGGGR